ncbi:hypothetical protein OAB37_01725 [Planktomarina temperata]|nr:hypothetical protein [Planktomarina temperata]
MTIQQHASFDSSAAELNATSKLVKAWESKNAKNAAKAGGISLMALSLAACGGSSTTTTATDTTATDTTAVAGSAFVLLATADVVTGTAGADTISGTSGSIDGDTINAGAGDDTLSITVSNADDDNASFAASGLELLQIRGTGNGVGVVDLDLGDVADLETVEFRRMAEDVTVTNLQDLDTALKISDSANANSNVIVNFDAAQVTGTEDSASLTVDNVTAGADFDVNGVETIAVTAVGTDNDIDIDGDDLESVTVSGSGDISIDVDASVTTFNASTATGDVTMVAAAAADVTATGGAGADTFAMAATLDAEDTIDGGDGIDVLSVTGAGGALIPALAAVTNVETLTATINGADTLDANIVSFDNINILGTAATDDVTITDLTDEVVTVTQTAAGVNIDNVNVSLVDATATDDALTVNVTNAHTTTVFNVDLIASAGGGIETLTVNLNQGVDLAADDIQVDVITAGTALTITGDADAELGADTPLTQTVINGGTATGDLTINVGAAASTVTGGSGADTFAFGANFTSTDTVVGGNGLDTLTATPAAGATAATVSGVETLQTTFGTASASVSMANMTGVTTLNIDGDQANTISAVDGVTAINLSSQAAASSTVAITFDAANTQDLTVTFGDTVDGTVGNDVDYGATAITTYAGALTVVSDGLTGNSVNGFDANTATSLNISTVLDLTVTGGGDDDFSATDATSVVVTTAGGALVIDDDLIVDEATSIELNATSGNLTITDDVHANTTATGGSTDVTMTATANATLLLDGDLDVDHMRTVTMTASNAGDIDVDGVVLTGVDAAGTDHVVSFTLTSDDQDSTINFDTGTASGAAVIDLITVVSGAGSTAGVEETTITNADTDVTITTIDASAAAGDLTIVLTTSNDVVSITTGSGDATVTSTTGADTIVLGTGDNTVRTQDGQDIITLSTGIDTIIADTFDDAVIVNGFDVAEDIIGIDLSMVNASVTNSLISGAGTTDVATFFNAVVQSDADGTVTLATGTNVLALTDIFADAAAVLAALDDNVTYQNDLAAADEALTVIWSDGASTYVSFAVVDDILTDADVPGYDAVEVMVELSGISIADLVDANLSFIA